MVEYPLVSIVLIVYNDQNYIKQLLSILFKSTDYPNFEIIVVDNASKESSKLYFQKNFPNVKYIYLPKNLGFGRANNIGMKNANGKYIQLLNTDTFPQKDWLTNSVRILEKKPDVGIVGCLTPACNVDKFELNYPSKINFINVAGVGGSCMLFPKKMIFDEKIGLFDPYFFFFSEDTDLCYRFWLNNYRVVLNLSSVVYHIKNLEQKSKKKTYKTTEFYTKSNLYFIFKYHPFLIAIRDMVKMQFFSIFVLITTHNIQKFKAELNGFLYFFRDIVKIYHIVCDFRKKYPNLKERLKSFEKLKFRYISNAYKFVFVKDWEYFTNELKKNQLRRTIHLM